MTDTQSYLVLWNPANEWPHPINTIRVVGAFATNAGLAAARKQMFKQRAEYAQEVAGHLRLVKSNGGEYLVEARPPRIYNMRGDLIAKPAA